MYVRVTLLFDFCTMYVRVTLLFDFCTIYVRVTLLFDFCIAVSNECSIWFSFRLNSYHCILKSKYIYYADVRNQVLY